MQNFTQKALMVVLSVFLLVGLFYGLSTPVKASAANMPTVGPHGGDPQPDCDPTTGSCQMPWPYVRAH